MNAKTTSASAPGKFILLGEHAVVFGKPAVALAIDKRVQCTVKTSDTNRINGEVLIPGNNPHIDFLLDKYGLDSVDVCIESEVPSGSGLGSSAALSSSLSAAIRRYLDLDVEKIAIAKDAFDTEYFIQGNASPLDTSCSTFGNGVVLNNDGSGSPLWTAEKNGKRWKISSIKAPKMTFVIGFTGIKASTGPLVAKVKKYTENSSFASEIIDEIEAITSEGIRCMENNDKEKLGKLMIQDHKLLSILGVSCSELNKLVDAALIDSYGAKLTGAGGGGSIVALTDRPEKVCEKITRHGGMPFVVGTSSDGVL